MYVFVHIKAFAFIVETTAKTGQRFAHPMFALSGHRSANANASVLVVLLDHMSLARVSWNVCPLQV